MFAPPMDCLQFKNAEAQNSWQQSGTNEGNQNAKNGNAYAITRALQL